MAFAYIDIGFKGSSWVVLMPVSAAFVIVLEVLFCRLCHYVLCVSFLRDMSVASVN